MEEEVEFIIGAALCVLAVCATAMMAVLTFVVIGEFL